MTDLEVDTMLGAEQPMSVGAAKTALEAFATAGLEARGVSERTGSLRAGGGSPTGGGMSDKGVSDTSNSMLRGKSGGASGQASPDAKKGAGKKGAFLRWPRQVRRGT